MSFSDNRRKTKESVAALIDGTRRYKTLPAQNQILLRTWYGSIGSFVIALFKFISGCMAGSGFLCVSALYSLLIGIAKRQVLRGRDGKGKEDDPYRLLRRMGVYILIAGAVYGVYLGRLILYPERAHWSLPAAILIALYSFIDVGIAIYTLVKKQEENEAAPLMYGRKLMSLAAALPMIVMTQIVLNSYASEVDTSAFDGRFGVIVGLAILAIGAGMVVYANRKIAAEIRM